jgi:hypothetical protein
VGYGDGGVSLVLEGRGSGFFVGQVFFQGVGLDGGSAAVLEIIVEGDEVGFGDGDGRSGGFSWRKRGGEIWIMDGDGEREKGEDGGELFGGLLRGLDGALLVLDGGQGGGELRVALGFAIAGLLDHFVLRGQGDCELLGIVASGAPGVGEEGAGDQGGDEDDEVSCGLHGVWRLVVGDLRFEI